MNGPLFSQKMAFLPPQKLKVAFAQACLYYSQIHDDNLEKPKNFCLICKKIIKDLIKEVKS